MKTAILIRNFDAIGGVEKYGRYLAEEFSRQKWEVTVLTTGEILRNYPFRVISFPTPSSFGYRKLKIFDEHCVNWLNKHPVDVVFGMDRNSCQTHYRAGNGVHAAYLERRSATASLWKKISFKINPLHNTILHFEKLTYQHPQMRRIFTNSQMVKDEIIRYYHTNPEKIHVVHNGVQWHEWQKPFDEWPFDKDGLLKRLNLPKAHFHMVFIGNEFRRKGLLQLLKALHYAKNLEIHLSVIGGKQQSIKEFQHIANKWQLSSQVTFFGQQNGVVPFYQCADCVVIPSIYDPFANVTIEALAMGCFVLSSCHNGGSEILTPTQGRVLKDIEDVEEFAHALNTCANNIKTVERAKEIRNSVKSLDFTHQLSKISQHLNDS